MARKQSRNSTLLFTTILIAICVCVSASCTTTPQYDQTTDSAISSLQKEVDLQLVQWMTYKKVGDADSLQKASYKSNIDFYSRVDSELTSLELRIEAVPDRSTEKLPTFFDNLRQQLSNLEKTHQQDGTLSVIVLTPIRNQLNAQFAVLLTYELSLKGVSSGSTSSTDSTATKTAAAKASPSAK